jgi:hypothetical protein
MRNAAALFAATIALMTALTMPALAKNSDSQKAEEKSASSTCHSYQMAADGSWTALPCAELGAAPRAQRKVQTQGANEDER